MTKPTGEVSKVKKPSAKAAEIVQPGLGVPTPGLEVAVKSGDEQESGSSSGSGEEGSSTDYTSGDVDTDHMYTSALNVVTKQATESKVVIPAVGALEPDDIGPTVQNELNLSIVSKESVPQQEAGDSSASNATNSKSRVLEKRKLEDEVVKKKKAKKLSKEKRDKIKARVASQVALLAASELAEQTKSLVGDNKIPKLSPGRLRQQKAVDQARQRTGLSSRYQKLSALLDLHRLLLKGNPFGLMDPKQVYPHFYSIPGINMAHIQPLVVAWQEKASKILYQLLLSETICDIARLKKRSSVLKAEPHLFTEIYALKIDIGLEVNPVPETLGRNNSESKNQDPHHFDSGLASTSEATAPPPKKIKK